MVVGGLFCSDPPRIPSKKDWAGTTTSGEAGNARRSTTERRATKDHADWGRGSYAPARPPPRATEGRGAGFTPTAEGGRGGTPPQH